MYGKNLRSPTIDIHRFAMIPRAEIPRSTFKMQSSHKTTFNASFLIPIFVQEVLPGDSWKVQMTMFCRTATPIFPIMDNMDIESFFFWCPARLLWSHWNNFMGEQPASPSDSISYTIPQCVSPAGGFAAESMMDYMGVAVAGQIQPTFTTSINVLPLRAYNITYNTWFRDQNIVTAAVTGATATQGDIGDGPDPYTNYPLQQPSKRHDYFTSALPWTQKGGGTGVGFLAGQANVKSGATTPLTGTSPVMTWLETSGSAIPTNVAAGFGATAGNMVAATGAITQQATVYPTNLYADLTTAGANTINSLRLAFQTQKLLERDARGGPRYQEIVRSHFGVMGVLPLYRPEYLGGGKSPVAFSPVPQTVPSYTGGPSSPAGTLSAAGTLQGRGHGFRGSFTEHGYILGLIVVRRDPIYQQGTRRMWTRQTRYDFYFPAFAMLGEQAIRNDEIYTVGTQVAGQDAAAFGYIPRWDEYRYMPSIVTGYFRSTYTTPLDTWHLGSKFTSIPLLTSGFLFDDTYTVFQRCAAGGASIAGEQFLLDAFFDITVARPLPMHSVPGLIDHF